MENNGEQRDFKDVFSQVLKEIEAMQKQIDAATEELQKRFDAKVAKIRQADELAPGVLKMVKVFITSFNL